ncbi:MAG: pectate lyase, partial [Firmicutes bacterium]|nr:pectate lyase [Bacillota bacterium]
KGGKPPGYLIEETGGSVEIAEVPIATDKSVYLYDPGDKNIKIARKFPAQTGVVTVRVSFMQPVAGSTAKVIRLLDPEGQNTAVHIETRKDGSVTNISYKNPDGSFTPLSAYEANRWYVIQIVADVAAQKAAVFIDGALKLDQAPFLSPVKAIGCLDSFTPGSSGKSHYLDNIKVYAGQPEEAAQTTAQALSSQAIVESSVPSSVPVTGSALIADLLVYDTQRAASWSVQPSIQVGEPLFGDRAYAIVSLPPAYVGYEWIRTACDSKKFTGEILATFKVTAPVTVYVAHDDRLVQKPAWLAHWIDTGDDLVDSETTPVVMSLFKKDFPAGSTVVLGNNGGSLSGVQYIVIVKGPDGPRPLVKPSAKAPVKITWDACLVQPSAWYAGEEAIRIADNVLLYQRHTGGWPKNIDMAEPIPEHRKSFFLAEKERTDDSTIDNGATVTQLKYLARVYKATGLERFKEGFLKGLDYLLAAQYPNGGWPQYYPNLKGYYANITFNDNAMVNVLVLLKSIAEKEPDYDFVDPARREKAARAVAKGIDCLLKTQIRVNGKLTAWCAQHDPKTLAPAPARSYELESISGSESVGIVRFLMTIEDPGPEVIQAVEAAVRWFEEVKLTGIKVVEKPDPSLPGGYDLVVVEDPNAPPIWARFYEIGTNRPFFCGRDGIKKYSLAEIEHERRVGYSWYTNAPAYLLEKEYPLWRAKHLGE